MYGPMKNRMNLDELFWLTDIGTVESAAIRPRVESDRENSHRARMQENSRDVLIMLEKLRSVSYLVLMAATPALSQKSLFSIVEDYTHP